MAPILMMVAPYDEIANANYSVFREVFRLITTQKRWYEIRGGHLGLIHFVSEIFDEASCVQIDLRNSFQFSNKPNSPGY